MKEKKTVAFYGIILILTVLTIGTLRKMADIKQRIAGLEEQMKLINERVIISQDQY